MENCSAILPYRIQTERTGYESMTEKKELTYDQAKNKALRLLEFRRHSERELCQKLRQSGARDEDIEEIADFCRRYHFLDDREYAIKKAADLMNLKKYGKRRIVCELTAKGIGREEIDEALRHLEESSEEPETVLLPLVRKRLKGDFERKNIDKTIRYFSYRGYEFSDIKRCIERIKEEDGI